MILAAAFCPQPPLLAPPLAGGAAAELDGLRAACDEVVGAIAEYGVAVLVLGPGPRTQTFGPDASGSLAQWGVDVRAGAPGGVPSLPLSLTVGAWLLDRAQVPVDGRRYVGVADDEPSDLGAGPVLEAGQDVVLLVMADGSSTRTLKAPGGLHAGAESYDAAIVEALEGGDASALADAADPVLSRPVGAAGALAWRAAARLLAGPPPTGSRVLTAEAPYGVAYPVALWTWAPRTDPRSSD